jgi:hypothetical protein
MPNVVGVILLSTLCQEPMWQTTYSVSVRLLGQVAKKEIRSNESSTSNFLLVSVVDIIYLLCKYIIYLLLKKPSRALKAETSEDHKLCARVDPFFSFSSQEVVCLL